MSDKRLCAFILPYYGKFPNYFQLFLNSCGTNPDYDWLVFTDDHTEYEYPANVHVHYETFQDMQERVKRRFNGDAELRTPYKLCDFKPIYGYLFEEYLDEYRFWGYGDCDVIYGQLNHFITERMLNEYDKIFSVGHLTLMRNTPENNRRFMLPLDGKPIWHDVVNSERIYTFDESYLSTNVNRIYQEHGFPIFSGDLSANTRASADQFELVHFDETLGVYMTESPLHAVYVWRDGELMRSYFRLGQFTSRELMYMHFQRRAMQVRIDPCKASCYKILPGSFEPLEVSEVTEQNFKTIRWKRLSNQIKHRWSIVRGDMKFWRKKILAKLGK
ncbi:DUF6625 family protein [Bifidobacterium leontopitheci]|uniref:Uncharacterized protein n=1 Tax=Bifidobacterium leontopitheci TaxID=2650774 RepID=A0A6I1GD36_9BIFI|nr:DUF6625 family protein [Bifidobacterium leontopitheci]KAB7789544.1 hypothetical protein F7D09_1941 [Bifidobacterium leontopitheci]